MFKKIFGLTKKEKEFSASPSTFELLDDQVVENKAQLWLNKIYPQELRNQIKSLEISGEWLGGSLDLTDFINLEELYCYDNKLTGIKFADSSLSKLRVLHVGNNNFPVQDLSLFSHLVALEMLNLSNNNFTGSLLLLEDLVNLQSLDISDTNIESGLNWLPKSLKSLFCRVEKEVGCRKIREELKNYHLGHDCYDLQTWRKVENLLNMPGSWYESNNIEEESSNERLDNLEAKQPSEEEKFLSLISDIYQDLILIEGEKINITFIKKNLEKFRSVLEEMQKQEENFNFYSFRSKFKFNLHDLVLVVERYVLTKEKENVLRSEEEMKKLRQNDILITKAKDELLCKTLHEAENYQDDISSLQSLLKIKKEEITELEETIIKLDEINEKTKNEKEILQAGLTKQNEEIIDLKEQIKIMKSGLLKNLYNKYKNKITINNMTSNNKTNEKKTYILEWKSADLKDGTMRYENFEVIAGSEKEELSFYSTFFTSNNKFKKGEIYELSTPGNFIQDSSEIIQGIDSGGHEFEKITPSLMIKELWEDKTENIEKLNLLEEDLKKKKEDANKVNQELSSKERQLNELQVKFNNLQSEKNKVVKEKEEINKKLNSANTDLQKKEEDFRGKEQELVVSKNETTQLQNRFNKLQEEKRKMETSWIDPEEKSRLLQEKEDFNNQLRTERRNKQKVVNLLEDLRGQGLNKTIQTKLEEMKKEQNQLKVAASDKLGGSSQMHLLESLLEKQEDFDLALFEDVNRTTRTFSRAQEKLQDIKDKLIVKLSTEEIEELCKMQTEIGKLENSQRQWEKMEDQQKKEEQERFESFIGTPPTTPRNSY